MKRNLSFLMRPRLSITVATYCLLGAAATVAFILPENLIHQATAEPFVPPDVIRLPGIARDFKKSNPTLTTAPSAGNGHYAGNVAHALSAMERPQYSGAGFRVSTQWREKNANPIAPHMYLNAEEMRKVRLVNAPTINNNPTIDTYNSDLGPYNLATAGPAPTFVSGSPMPSISAPTDIPLSADYIRDGNATTVFSTDVNCNKFLIRNHHRLQISGQRRIVANEEMTIENYAKIELLPGATLTIWLKKDATIKNDIDFNKNTADPSRVVIYNIGPNYFTLENSSATYCTIYAPTGGLHVKNSAQFCGQYTGKLLQIDNGCGFHIDTNGPPEACGVEFADSAGTAGSASNAGMISAASFDNWFADALGTNLSTVHAIELVRNNSGIYEFSDDNFFPVDNALFGNEGDSHNYYFTYVLESTFEYDSCAGQFFEIECADDAWLYVGSELVIDLGGVLPGTRQYIDMDRLELVDGKTYTVHLFYAQRNTAISRFNLRTNLELKGEDVVYTMSAGTD